MDEDSGAAPGGAQTEDVGAVAVDGSPEIPPVEVFDKAILSEAQVSALVPVVADIAREVAPLGGAVVERMRGRYEAALRSDLVAVVQALMRSESRDQLREELAKVGFKLE